MCFSDSLQRLCSKGGMSRVRRGRSFQHAKVLIFRNRAFKRFYFQPESFWANLHGNALGAKSWSTLPFAFW